MAVTVTPGITPPCWSLMVPATRLRSNCANAGEPASSSTAHAIRHCRLLLTWSFPINPFLPCVVCRDMRPSLPVRHSPAVPAPQRRRAWNGQNCVTRRATPAPRRKLLIPIPRLLVSPLPRMTPPTRGRTAVEPAGARRSAWSRQTACSQEHGERRTSKGLTQPLCAVKNHLAPSGTHCRPSGLTSRLSACTQSLLCSTSRNANRCPTTPEWFDQSSLGGPCGGGTCGRAASVRAEMAGSESRPYLIAFTSTPDSRLRFPCAPVLLCSCVPVFLIEVPPCPTDDNSCTLPA